MDETTQKFHSTGNIIFLVLTSVCLKSFSAYGECTGRALLPTSLQQKKEVFRQEEGELQNAGTGKFFQTVETVPGDTDSLEPD